VAHQRVSSREGYVDKRHVKSRHVIHRFTLADAGMSGQRKEKGHEKERGVGRE
jgi:hypothetical protein